MIFITGRNSVEEALKSRRYVERVFISEKHRNDSRYLKLVEIARKKGVQVDFIPEKRLFELTDKVKQGILAKVEDFKYVEIEEIAESLNDAPSALIVVLDSVEDPQNLGNIIRTAEFFGADAVVIRKKRSAQVTPVVERISQGATNYIRISRVPNIARALNLLKENDFFVVGLTAKSQNVLVPDVFRGRTVIVVGGEDKGLSRLTEEACDVLVALPGKGSTGSLNAASAFAAAAYCWRIAEIVR